MDGRLVGAAGLQVVIADQFHVGGFGRSPDHLALDHLALDHWLLITSLWITCLGTGAAAEDEECRDIDRRFDVTVHVFPPTLSKPICVG